MPGSPTSCSSSCPWHYRGGMRSHFKTRSPPASSLHAIRRFIFLMSQCLQALCGWAKNNNLNEFVHIVTRFLASGMSMILGFSSATVFKFQDVNSSAVRCGALMRGFSKICDFQQKSPFILVTVRDRSVIGNHMQAIDLCNLVPRTFLSDLNGWKRGVIFFFLGGGGSPLLRSYFFVILQLPILVWCGGRSMFLRASHALMLSDEHRRRQGYEVGGTNSGAKRRKNFFQRAPRPKFALCPPIPGHSGGKPQWKTDIVKITRVENKALLTW